MKTIIRSAIPLLTSISLVFAPLSPAYASLSKLGSGLNAKRGSFHNYREGEVLVKMRSGMTTSQGTSMMARHGVSSLGALPSKHTRVHVDDGMSVMDKIDELRTDPDVESVQPNYIYHTLAVPNDPSYPQLWGLKNSAQKITNGDYATANPGTANKDMGMEAAWDLINDCSSVPVAVIDTGVNYNHEELKNNMWNGGATYPNHGYDFVDNDNDPMDLNGHGTHVSSTIGAAGNNGVGITGVCWKSQIMAVRVLDPSGSGSTANIVNGINFATAHGAKVISMSLGMNGDDPALETALKAASDAGLVIVVAAGNDGKDNDANGGTPTYPCASTVANLICVAALDQSFGLASFSNYGAKSVDVGAPGTNILSGFAGSKTTIADSFHNAGSNTTNWTTSGGGWTYGVRSLKVNNVPTNFDMFFNPSNWDGATAKYGNNLDSRAYKMFNLAGFNSASLEFFTIADIDATDFVAINEKPTGGDPFVGGTELDSLTGTTSGSAVFLSYDITDCRTATCSLGFRLKTDAATTDFGMALLDFAAVGLTLNTNSYQILDGTSMATPHVTGLAAMLFAYNPKFTAADVVTAIKAGGIPQTSLAGKTTTGNAANGPGSLKYIAPVTGLKATSL